MGAEAQLSAHTPGTCGPRGANRGEEMGRQLNTLELQKEQLHHFKRYIISLLAGIFSYSAYHDPNAWLFE